MRAVGIEAIGTYAGAAYLPLDELAQARSLDPTRFQNLRMKEKAVALPFEDPMTFAVNAAKPLIDGISEAQKQRIELLITCTESGIDFGKSVSTYVHHYLGLSRNCRLFEIKQACYSATAGLQMAAGFLLSQCSPGAKALVIATDMSRFVAVGGGEALSEDWSYAEPSAGAGGVALLVGETPAVFSLDVGASGYYGYEVMDTCRPVPDSESGNADLSLLSYLDCCEQAYIEYTKRVADVDYLRSFDYLAFHTPFGGMVKGAHRMMMRKFCAATPSEVATDFEKRVAPGLEYCERVGNIMGGSLFLALASLLEYGEFSSPRRIGCFSYGSGCCAEFFSGVAGPGAQRIQRMFGAAEQLAGRYRLSMQEYESLIATSTALAFGTRDVTIDRIVTAGADWYASRRGLALVEINNFHRRYEWRV